MAITKISAKGTVIKHGSTASPTDVLEGVRSVSLNQGAREMLDATTHDSTTTKEYVDSGLRETPELEVEITLDPTNTGHNAIRGAHAAGTLYYITLVLPDSGVAQWALTGYVTDFRVPNLATNAVLSATFTFKARSVDTFTQ